jgi:hypothetical protein
MIYVAFFGVELLFAKLAKIIAHPRWFAAVTEKFGHGSIIEMLKELKRYGRNSDRRLLEKQLHSFSYSVGGECAENIFYLTQIQVTVRALLIQCRRLMSRQPKSKYSESQALIKLSLFINFLCPISFADYPHEHSAAILSKNLFEHKLCSADTLGLIRKVEPLHNYFFAKSLCDVISGSTCSQIGQLLLCASLYDPSSTIASLISTRRVIYLILNLLKCFDKVTNLSPHPLAILKRRRDLKHSSYSATSEEFCFELHESNDLKCRNCDREICSKVTYRQPLSGEVICKDCLMTFHINTSIGSQSI